MKRIFKILILLTAAAWAFGWLYSCRADRQQTAIHPQWSYNAVIYELNMRQFTPEGTFAATSEHLDRLKELGVDILWIMPIQPIGVEARKGELGSYYSISDYTAVNPEYGTIDDFRSFVRQARERGMKVILDWVANHTSRDAVWLREGHRDWYVLNEVDGQPAAPFDWTDVAELNYDNPQMREAMIEAMEYWIREVGLDGFRCDVADEVPLDFWEEAVARLRKIDPQLFMLAEAENPALHNGTFDMTYGWHLHHLLNRIARGEIDADNIRQYLSDDRERFPHHAFRMYFTSNHDENSWNGTEFERMGDAARTLAAFTYVIPGMPLIYNGQEAGFDRRLEFFTKDSIDWPGDTSFAELYRKLNALRHDNPALASGERGAEPVDLPNDAPQQVISFQRTLKENTVVAVFNLSGRPATTLIDTRTLKGEFTDVIGGGKTTFGDETEFALLPWQYYIYVR